jgi:hypothetical protein
MPPAAAFNQFVATLRLQGFAWSRPAGCYKVVPEADAKLQGGTVSVHLAAARERQPDRHADLPAQLRDGQQPGAHPAAADQRRTTRST